MVSVVTVLPHALTGTFVRAPPHAKPQAVTSICCDPQAPGDQPLQAGRAQAAAEAPEEGEEEGDGAKPVGRRRQTAGQHHPGLRRPGPKAAEQVSSRVGEGWGGGVSRKHL